jgi:hypothetical protein
MILTQTHHNTTQHNTTTHNLTCLLTSIQFTEWRRLGVQQSRGWEHYAFHRPEPHILLFRRPLGTDPHTGEVDPEMERESKDQYQQQLLVNTRK